MNVLDIFSGLGGFSVGLERAGMRTVAFCELDSFCQLVLRGNWPGIPIFDDVRELTAATLADAGVGRVDVIAGGFPCQDVSVAGARAGLDGARSGLWGEYARLIGELRPRYIIVENVSGLISGDEGRWFGRILGDLAALGFDAEWHCVPAAAVGAPHLRDRLWLVAYRDGDDLRLDEQRHARRRDAVQHGGNAESGHDGASRIDPDADSGRREVGRLAQSGGIEGARGREPDGLRPVRELEHAAPDATDANGNVGIARRANHAIEGEGRRDADGSDLRAHVLPDAASTRPPFGQRLRSEWARALAAVAASDRWAAEPGVGPVVDGFPGRAPAIRALGNAIVPPIAEAIGRAIVSADDER